MEAKAKNLFMLIGKAKNDELKNFVLRKGIEVRDDEKKTALIHAAFYNNLGLLSWLIDNKADVNAADKNGYTALHFACEKGFIDAIKLLIASGANLNKPDYYGNTPAWIAITHWKGGQNMPVLKELYEHNANLSLKNNAGYSPLDIMSMSVMNAL